VTRGEVWEYAAGSALHRAVIISTDEHHVDPAAIPVGLAIRRDLSAVGPWMIELGAGEPTSGTVLVMTPVRIDPTGLRRSLGYLSPRALAAVEAGMRDFYVLP
jgi:hypothetical protein